jgi:hypothetical protein
MWGSQFPPHVLGTLGIFKLLHQNFYDFYLCTIGNTLGEHIGNLMATHWELEGNILGTKEK